MAYIKERREYLSLGGITKGSRRMRLLGKFVENECEKIDRLMEFYTRYICCGERGLPYLFGYFIS